MLDSPVVKLTNKENRENLPFFLAFALAVFLETVCVHFLARIWLSMEYSLLVAIVHFLLGMALLDWLFLLPRRLPHLLTPDALILKHGHSLKVTIPLDNISSLGKNHFPNSKAVLAPEKDKKTGIMFMSSGKDRALLLKLRQPVKVKGLWNYGYADQFVFNLDNPSLLQDIITPQDIPPFPREDNKMAAPEPLEDSNPAFLPPSSLSPVLSLEHVTKEFAELTAVHNLNLHFYPGEVFGLLGSNGAGKTTTLKMICSWLQPSGGKIDAGSNTIAYMPENLLLYERMTGREFLHFLAVLYNTDTVETPETIEQYLSRFDMLPAADRLIASYSQGMKRKISLIATIIKGTDILVLDEPSNGLDPTGILQVKLLLREMAEQGKTIIISTHILEMAEKLCDRVAVIAGGHLLFVGTLADLREKSGMEHASLEDIFFRLIQE